MTLAVTPTSIAGLLHVSLEVHADERGWLKESYQRVKLERLGLPRLDAVQNNVVYSASVGVTRGIHAEPWDKYVSPACGRVFAAVVDLRAGEGFGRVETFELGPDAALYVPRGCGNAYCTLEPHTVYNYLVNDHWSADAQYTNVDLFDAELGIRWPVGRERMVLSAKDVDNPPLSAVEPIVVP